MTSTEATGSNFAHVVMAARRARQLQNGCQPLIATQSSKACRVAQEEIAAGKVKAASHKSKSAQSGPDIQQGGGL